MQNKKGSIMICKNLESKEELFFSHSNPLIAFSYVRAMEQNKMMMWSGLSIKEKEEYVSDFVTKTSLDDSVRYSYGNWEILFDPIK